MPKWHARRARCSSTWGGATRWRALAPRRITTTLDYRDGDDACNAALIGGPVALAWSRFDDHVRARVRERYLAAIAAWKRGRGYAIPGEFLIVVATAAMSRARE